MSDRLELLKPLITPAIQEMARARLMNRVGLIKDGERVPEERKQQSKIALLLVHIMNPYEEFFAPEEALIRGISTDTLAKRKQQPNGLKKL